MPMPQPKKNEKQNNYMGRCMDFLSKEERPQKQKVAICLNTYRNPKEKAKAEIEIDFSEDIKNMNKKEQIKIEETPKVEAKIEAPEVKAEEIIKTETKAEVNGKGEGADFVAAIPESTKKEHNLS
jgi:hypothetical protein